MASVASGVAGRRRVGLLLRVRFAFKHVVSRLGVGVVGGIGLGLSGDSSFVPSWSGSTAPKFPFLVATFCHCELSLSTWLFGSTNTTFGFLAPRPECPALASAENATVVLQLLLSSRPVWSDHQGGLLKRQWR